jgi:hypothetical protein
VNTNSDEPEQQETPKREAKGTGKRPYVKPMVRYERVFETMALSCGKVQSTEGSCHFNRRTS